MGLEWSLAFSGYDWQLVLIRIIFGMRKNLGKPRFFCVEFAKRCVPAYNKKVGEALEEGSLPLFETVHTCILVPVAQQDRATVS